MSEWVPLFQSVLWPAVVVVGVLWFRPVIARVLAAVATRIEQGDTSARHSRSCFLQSMPYPGSAR